MMAVFPQHPRPSCHAVIFDGDHVLLVRRANEPFRNLWGLPGGAVELGETVAAALQREVQEETGLAVSVGPLIHYLDGIQYQEQQVRYHYVILFFRAYLIGGKLEAASDADEAAWFHRLKLTSVPLVPGALDIIQRAWRVAPEE